MELCDSVADEEVGAAAEVTDDTDTAEVGTVIVAVEEEPLEEAEDEDEDEEALSVSLKGTTGLAGIDRAAAQKWRVGISAFPPLSLTTAALAVGQDVVVLLFEACGLKGGRWAAGAADSVDREGGEAAAKEARAIITSVESAVGRTDRVDGWGCRHLGQESMGIGQLVNAKLMHITRRPSLKTIGWCQGTTEVQV
ncbi:MAG: hypothetical protein Q9217_000952 [Psora testacea]